MAPLRGRGLGAKYCVVGYDDGRLKLTVSDQDVKNGEAITLSFERFI